MKKIIDSKDENVSKNSIEIIITIIKSKLDGIKEE
jgi:hypothetical protein